MKKFIFLNFVFLLIMLVAGCEKNDDELTQTSVLEKSWTRSYEEETLEEIEIYRPSDSKDFPLSRYRQIFNFKDNNVCEYLILAANDAHYLESGFWDYNEKTNIVTIFNLDFEILYVFEVVELTDILLRLKAI